MSNKNALYCQSGGVTAVINATACGVIEAARKNPNVGTVFGAKNGIIGVLREELVDTSQHSDEDIAALRHTPGGAFGSCRYKLKDMEAQKAEYERLIDVFQAHDIGYFLYNGGGDSSDTAFKVSQMAKSRGLDVTCIGVPKTIDNDLPVTDTCPGFGTTAKYIATSIMEASLDVESMAESSTKVFIMEVMGRHAGWIAAAGGLAAQSHDEPPQIILFPEIPFDQQAFLARVKWSVENHGYCSVVVSEGVRNPDGKFLADAGTVDAFGHAQLGGVASVIAQMVKDQLGYKYHYAISDYLQRSARHLASKTDLEQAYAVGEKAIELAVAGQNSVMPVIKRLQDDPYQWEIATAELKDLANVEKMLPRDYITDDGFGITEKCRTYMQPLIVGEAYPPYNDNGLPHYVRLSQDLTSKKLPHFEI
ncbi:6-phosphofructokinase [Marinicella sp. S1101]|uniref:6-phosphofructokinase n=1 Tax=Marinicella marina TaxID=2996016 RepID=UPI002260CC94|nr:6-phosphofructokinase [Marinicella marina]MCX7554233.1 6-phosphofructokinase [Marinicella marina]MDJ1138774.1 6-phosphofructokinase [Marinicella marina]